jgi:hypothetical protein
MEGGDDGSTYTPPVATAVNYVLADSNQMMSTRPVRVSASGDGEVIEIFACGKSPVRGYSAARGRRTTF